MQIDSQLMLARIRIQLRPADIALLARQLLGFLAVIFSHHLVVVSHGLRDFLLAHPSQTLHYGLVVVAGGIVGSEIRAEDFLVAVDRVVADRVAEELQVHADLVRAAGQGKTAHDAVAVAFAAFLTHSGRVVCHSSEDRSCGFPAGAHAVQAQFGRDLQQGLFADNFAFGELAFDARDVFLADGAAHDFRA